MELHYRGIAYSSDSDALETTESTVVGHYRGATWRMRQAKPNSGTSHSGARVKYRGAWVR